MIRHWRRQKHAGLSGYRAYVSRHLWRRPKTALSNQMKLTPPACHSVRMQQRSRYYSRQLRCICCQISGARRLSWRSKAVLSAHRKILSVCCLERMQWLLLYQCSRQVSGERRLWQYPRASLSCPTILMRVVSRLAKTRGIQQRRHGLEVFGEWRQW